MKRWILPVLACVALCGCAASDGANTADDPSRDEPAAGLNPMGVDKAITAQIEAEEAATVEESADLAEARKAVENDPTNPVAHRRLGIALRYADRADEAFEHLEKAVELAPQDTDGLLSLGIAYSTEHRLSEAEAAYGRILEIAPDHARAINNLGNVAVRRGDEQRAIELYQRAAEADPEYVLAMQKQADLLKYHGRNDEAYAVYERILEMKPKNRRERIAVVESLYGMGSINLSRREYELAEQQLAQVVRNIPNHRSAHWARAQALTQLGRPDEAQQELQVHVRILHAMGSGF